ncbi:MAG: hypothetical protein IJC46_01050 [Clostridia bacterium]|nr:hypothetical protein [Clostridia bacterium]
MKKAWLILSILALLLLLAVGVSAEEAGAVSVEEAVQQAFETDREFHTEKWEPTSEYAAAKRTQLILNSSIIVLAAAAVALLIAWLVNAVRAEGKQREYLELHRAWSIEPPKAMARCWSFWSQLALLLLIGIIFYGCGIAAEIAIRESDIAFIRIAGFFLGSLPKLCLLGLAWICGLLAAIKGCTRSEKTPAGTIVLAAYWVDLLVMIVVVNLL